MRSVFLQASVFTVCVALSAPVTSFAQGVNAGRLDAAAGDAAAQDLCIELSQQSRYIDELCFDNIVVDYSATMLMGEPVLRFDVAWYMPGNLENFERGGLSGNAIGDNFSVLVLGDERSQPVIDALHRVRITDLHMYGRVKVDPPEFTEDTAAFREREAIFNRLRDQTQDGRTMIPIPVDVLGPPGGAGYSTAGSPDWGALFIVAGGYDPCTQTAETFHNAETARELSRYGYSLDQLRICSASLSHIGAVDTALENTCLAWERNSPTYNQCMLSCPDGAQPDASGERCLVADAGQEEKVDEFEDALAAVVEEAVSPPAPRQEPAQQPPAAQQQTAETDDPFEQDLLAALGASDQPSPTRQSSNTGTHSSGWIPPVLGDGELTAAVVGLYCETGRRQGGDEHHYGFALLSERHPKWLVGSVNDSDESNLMRRLLKYLIELDYIDGHPQAFYEYSSVEAWINARFEQSDFFEEFRSNFPNDGRYSWFECLDTFDFYYEPVSDFDQNVTWPISNSEFARLVENECEEIEEGIEEANYNHDLETCEFVGNVTLSSEIPLYPDEPAFIFGTYDRANDKETSQGNVEVPVVVPRRLRSDPVALERWVSEFNGLYGSDIGHQAFAELAYSGAVFSPNLLHGDNQYSEEVRLNAIGSLRLEIPTGGVLSAEEVVADTFFEVCQPGKMTGFEDECLVFENVVLLRDNEG